MTQRRLTALAALAVLVAGLSWTAAQHTLAQDVDAGGPAAGTALAQNPSPPAAPTDLVAVGGDGRVALTWTVPEDLRYRLSFQFQYKTTGDYSEWRSAGRGSAGHVVGGLTNGTLHTFRVRARNAVGDSPPSDAATATPNPAPAPGPPDLKASSDLGGDSEDEITSDTTPTLTVSSVSASATAVQIIARKGRSELIAVADPAGQTSVEVTFTAGQPSQALTEGAWNLTAYQTVGGGPSAASAPLTVNVDTTRPTLDSAAYTVSTKALELTFSEKMDASSLNPAKLHISTNGSSTRGVTLASPQSASTTDQAAITVTLTDQQAQTLAGLAPPLQLDADADAASDFAGNPNIGATNNAMTITAAAPGAPDLADGSDTGGSNSDDITKDSTPTLDVSGVAAGAEVAVTAAAPGQAAVTHRQDAGAGSATVSLTLPTLADAAWSVTATQKIAGTTSAASAALSITIDTTKPNLKSANYNKNTRNLTMNFSETVDVSTTDLDKLHIRTTGFAQGGVTLGPDAARRTFTDGPTVVVRLTANQDATLTGITGPELDIDAEAVHDPAGNRIDAVFDTRVLVPEAPTGLTAVGRNQSVDLAWTNPTNTTITGHQYCQKISDACDDNTDADWTDITPDDASRTSHKVTGLDNDLTYKFKVRAVNQSTRGASSAEATATTLDTPDAPLGFHAIARNRGATIRWADPKDPSITGYQYCAKRVRPGATCDDDNDDHWRTCRGCSIRTRGIRFILTNYITYMFKVRAVNNAGPGPSSIKQTVVPVPPPAAPTGFTATAGNDSVRLSWNNPNNTTIRQYQFCQKTDDSTCSDYGYLRGEWGEIFSSNASTTSHTVPYLKNGTLYRFKLRAVNSSGNGAHSAQVTITPGIPNAPRSLTAAPGHNSAVLSWTAPQGGGTPSEYEYQYKTTDGGTYNDWAYAGDSTLHTVTAGLTNGTSYSFRVRAKNDAGEGAASNEARAIPAPPPFTPPPAQPPFTPTPSPSTAPPPGGPPVEPPGGSPPVEPPGGPPGGSPGGPPPGGSPPGGPPPGGSPGGPPGGSPPGGPPGGSPPGEPSPPSPPPPSPGSAQPPGSPPSPVPPYSGETAEGGGQPPEPAVEVRIAARRLDDLRIEFALQQRADGAWGSRRKPALRFFPPTTAVGRWLRSTTLNIDGQRLRIVARRLSDGRVEFGIQHRRGSTWSARILPRRRYFPISTRADVWLYSSPLWAHPHEPRPAVCNRTSGVAEALAEAADKSCAEVTGVDLAAITRLNLSNIGLSTLRATDFGGLANLTTLNLTNNRLTTLQPGTLTHIPRLTTLNLTNNRLTRFRAGALRGAGRLTTLTLDNNRLTSVSSRTLSDAPNLQSLSIAHNRISALRVNTFTQLRRLRTLNLTGNPGATFYNLQLPSNTTIIQ